MSGIVGTLDLRGAPADVPTLRRMTASMTFRGPDGDAVWTDGPVGLGHTLTRVSMIAGTSPRHSNRSDIATSRGRATLA
jgi:asparagine synthetase B (glutamine-hydrolysing)